MTAAPDGTVTLLFTDIEGSTRLLERAGEAYTDLLAVHNHCLRQAFGAHGGYEVDTAGDAFFVAFASAKQAVAGAAAAQQALAAHEWPEGERVWVRMGLHTGEPRLTDGTYVGLDVHQAARVMAAGHGGQVLLSQSTRDLLGDGTPLRDLGEHRLKDLSRPQRLYQLHIKGLQSEFPALKTLESRPTNLPVQPTPLIGRERELAEVSSLLARDDVRVLTLTGPGGTGKTRLALQAAADAIDEFRDGVYFVSLATITDADLVVPTLAQILGLREQPDESVRDTLARYLHEKQTLLLLDNLEQIPEAATHIADLIASAPGVVVVATSRQPLNVSGERLYAVPPLGLPDLAAAPSAQAISEYESVRLFTMRADAVRDDFAITAANAETVAEICIRLDGLPLALELAAARIRVLSPEAMLARLDQRLKLLTGGRKDLDQRQRTLRATIEWSYALLSDEEKLLFARLGVFAGGCRLDAATKVCDPDGNLGVDVFDGIASLVEKSLLRQRDDPDGEPRFWMLETIREYAAERLAVLGEVEARELDAVEHLLSVIEAANPHLRGAERALWLGRLQAEGGNIRAALGSAATIDPDRRLHVATALAEFFFLRGRLREGSEALEATLQASNDPPTSVMKDALLAACRFAHRLGNYPRAERYASDRLDLCRRINDSEGIAHSLLGIALVAVARNDSKSAVAALEESAEIARTGGYRATLADALGNLGDAAMVDGRHAEAKRFFREALGVFHELGDLRHVAATVGNLGALARREGRFDEADTLLREAISYSRESPDPEIAIWCLDDFIALAASRNDLKRTARLLGAIEAARFETGYVPQPSEQQIDEQVKAIMADSWDRPEIQRELAAGRTLTLSEAIAYALSESTHT